MALAFLLKVGLSEEKEDLLKNSVMRKWNQMGWNALVGIEGAGKPSPPIALGCGTTVKSRTNILGHLTCF